MDQAAYSKAILFVDRLDRRYASNRRVGWVYVMRNQEFARPLFKIGMTTRAPFERAAELGRTSVPGTFDLVYFVHVADAKMAETHVHQHLEPYRYQSNREFFEAPLGVVVSLLDQVAEALPLQSGPRARPLPQAFPAVIRVCGGCGQKNRVRSLAVPMRPKCGACGTEMEAV